MTTRQREDRITGQQDCRKTGKQDNGEKGLQDDETSAPLKKKKRPPEEKKAPPLKFNPLANLPPLFQSVTWDAGWVVMLAGERSV